MMAAVDFTLSRSRTWLLLRPQHLAALVVIKDLANLNSPFLSAKQIGFESALQIQSGDRMGKNSKMHFRS